MIKKLDVTIKDIKWTFDILMDYEYEAKHGTSSHGITDKDRQEVEFKLTSFSLKLIRHELFHTYVSSCCINSINELDENSIEELGAEIVEYHIEDILRLSKKIYKKLAKKELLLKELSKELNKHEHTTED